MTVLTILTHMNISSLGFPDKPPRYDEMATSTKWFETTTRNESALSCASERLLATTQEHHPESPEHERELIPFECTMHPLPSPRMSTPNGSSTRPLPAKRWTPRLEDVPAGDGRRHRSKREMFTAGTKQFHRRFSVTNSSQWVHNIRTADWSDISTPIFDGNIVQKPENIAAAFTPYLLLLQ